MALAELHSSRMPGPSRQTEHRILAAPLVRSIAETSDTDAPRQSSFDGSLHQFRREESQRDRHIDLSNAAFVARSNLLGTRDGAGNDLIKPMPATCDRCDERGASLSTNGSTVVRRHGRRRDDVASSLHVRLPPWDAQTPVSSSARLSLLRWFELDRQLVRLHLDADDMGTDEVSVSSWCRILEVLADGTSNEG